MQRTTFNEGWLFSKEGGVQRRPLTLPHDATQEEKRRADAPSGAGGAYYEGGKYTYEKTFDAPTTWQGKTVLLEFEGVYRNPKVYLNGVEVGGTAYGYLPFFVDLTPALQLGQPNTITVTAENQDHPNSRFYSGSGIYRQVWLWQGDADAHIPPQGIKVTTLAYNPPRIRIEAEHTGGEIELEVYDADTCVTKATGNKAELEIPDAKLWSDETPQLYTCRAALTVDGAVRDTASTTFGIRLLEWGPKGFFVNGQETLLRGGCVHHDNGILGACSYAKSEERRVRIMKEAGFNAIRSSHYPAAPAMLEACDKQGVYLLDETWDVWKLRKNPYDYASQFPDNWRSDLEALVNRDYNHPSVVMYSIGNEISDPYNEEGLTLEKELVDAVHALDPTRPVTAGINSMILYSASKGQGMYQEDGGGLANEAQGGTGEQKAAGSLFFNMMTAAIGPGMEQMPRTGMVRKVVDPAQDLLDIAGYNYGSGCYRGIGRHNPGRLVLGTETFRHTIARNWAMVKELPYLIGDFQWAGWDYLGETGCGAWVYDAKDSGFSKPYPWLLAASGSIDILGHPGAEADYSSAVWDALKAPAIHVRPLSHAKDPVYKSAWRGTDALPSWSWRGCEGQKAEVEVYFDAAYVVLFSNGKRVGRKNFRRCKAKFKVPYQPGTLEAVAYAADGKALAKTQLISAKGPLHLRLTPEDTMVRPGELVYIDVDIVGENNQIEANADTPLTLQVENGELLAFGSAQPKTDESYLSGQYTPYYGRAQAVVRATKPGTICVTATGDGLAGKVSIPVGESTQ